MSERESLIAARVSTREQALVQFLRGICSEASYRMKRTTGEGYTHEQGRYEAAKDTLDYLETLR